MEMPTPDAGTLARRNEIIAALKRILPADNVLSDDVEMRVYESDGLTAYQQMPMVVALPETTEQVSALLAYCHANDIKVVPRGAGTSL
ncbi:MAG: FAD-binding protein, partial [Rhodospirillaceae bacterium]|nr:FAD-binding protein [Rhodospirillaceae bacterium]